MKKALAEDHWTDESVSDDSLENDLVRDDFIDKYASESVDSPLVLCLDGDFAEEDTANHIQASEDIVTSSTYSEDSDYGLDLLSAVEACKIVLCSGMNVHAKTDNGESL